MISAILAKLKTFFVGEPKPLALCDESIDFLIEKVAFYKALSELDRRLFDKRVLLFLDTTQIRGYSVEVTQQDRLLVAAGAIIPVWSFSNWHYFNLHTVTLMKASFNEEYELGQPDSLITGMVGTGPLDGHMVLSQPALHYGFYNSKDKKNVAIHEFAHLIDMADGDCDGFPERLRQYAHFQPWSGFVEKKIAEIHAKRSNINPYGATNKQEFFAVATEYFFERPKLLQTKHPILYEELMAFYQQDTAAIAQDIEPKRNAPCPCGSNKKYKRCCLPQN